MCFVVQIRFVSYCFSLVGHAVLISNVGLEEPVQIWDNSTRGWDLMTVAYVKSTSSACASSCVVSWVRGFWTAPRQLKPLKRGDELQHCSSPVKRSPRTNTEGGWSHSCVRKVARTPLIFFFNLPLPCHLNSLHYLQHPFGGALRQTRNRFYDSSAVPPPFFSFFFFSSTFEGHSVSLFFWDDTLSPLSSCHLPPERQPTSADHTADPGRCPRVDTGAGGGGTEVGWQNRQQGKEPLTEMSGRRDVKKKKGIGLGGHYLWSDAGRSALTSSAGVLTSTKDISQMLQPL